ncbi:MAG: hypothetical protein IPJ35_07340 [Elusimicrobia bacterium]|nr:hypothetical protein [Elusimicrobiota bacterium]
MSTQATFLNETSKKYVVQGLVEFVDGQAVLNGNGAKLSVAAGVTVTFMHHTLSNGAEVMVSNGRLLNMSDQGSVTLELTDGTKTAHLAVEYLGRLETSGVTAVANRLTLLRGDLPAEAVARDTGESLHIVSGQGLTSIKMQGDLSAKTFLTTEGITSVMGEIAAIRNQAERIGAGQAGLMFSVGSVEGGLVYSAEGRQGDSERVVVRDWKSATANLIYITNGQRVSAMSVNGTVQSAATLTAVNNQADKLGITSNLAVRVLKDGPADERVLMITGTTVNGYTAMFEGVVGKALETNVRAILDGTRIVELNGMGADKPVVHALNSQMVSRNVVRLDRIMSLGDGRFAVIGQDDQGRRVDIDLTVDGAGVGKGYSSLRGADGLHDSLTVFRVTVKDVVDVAFMNRVGDPGGRKSSPKTGGVGPL